MKVVSADFATIFLWVHHEPVDTSANDFFHEGYRCWDFIEPFRDILESGDGDINEVVRSSGVVKHLDVFLDAVRCCDDVRHDVAEVHANVERNHVVNLVHDDCGRRTWSSRVW